MNRLLSILLLTVLSQLSITYAQNMGKDYIDCLSVADSLIKKSDFQGAENKFTEAMKLEPDNPMNPLLMSNIGLVRLHAGNDSLALDILNKAAEMFPSSVVVRSNRAKALTATGKLIEAETEYRNIAALDSTIAEPRYMQTIINLRLGSTAVADSISAETLRRFPSNLQAQEARAYTLVALSDFAAALPILNRAIDTDPSANNFAQRAFCNLMLDELSNASADINQALNLDPLNAELYLYRALLNKKRFRPADSEADVRHARELGASSSQINRFGLM